MTWQEWALAIAVGFWGPVWVATLVAVLVGVGRGYKWTPPWKKNRRG